MRPPWTLPLAAIAVVLALAAPAQAATRLPSTIGGVHGYTGVQGHSGHTFTTAELRTIADQSDIVVGLPVQIHKYWRTLRHYNRHIRFYLYQNGMFGQQADCAHYPTSWKLHSASGAGIISPNHNCLMNPYSGWTSYVVSQCRLSLAQAGVGRGCFLDQMSGVGFSGFVSALPVNPLTHHLFSARGYLAAVARVGNAVAARMPVIGNSYESGRKYFTFPTSALDASRMGGFEAEHWLGTTQPRDLETPSVWRASVQMLIQAQRHGKHVLINFGDLSSSLAQWQAFNVASMMLGNDGSVWLHFDSSNSAGPNSWQLDAPILHLRIGRPTETHKKAIQYFAGHVYLRRYSHGLVVVNPSGHTYRLSLGGTYTTPTGSKVSHLVMTPYSGTVLRHR